MLDYRIVSVDCLQAGLERDTNTVGSTGYWDVSAKMNQCLSHHVSHCFVRPFRSTSMQSGNTHGRQ